MAEIVLLEKFSCSTSDQSIARFKANLILKQKRSDLNNAINQLDSQIKSQNPDWELLVYDHPGDKGIGVTHCGDGVWVCSYTFEMWTNSQEYESEVDLLGLWDQSGKPVGEKIVDPLSRCDWSNFPSQGMFVMLESMIVELGADKKPVRTRIEYIFNNR